MYIRWNYIYDSMKSKKITNKQMSVMLGLSDSTWDRYRHGKNDITLKVFYELLKILKLDFNSVVKENELSESNLKEKIDECLKINKTRTIKFKINK